MHEPTWKKHYRQEITEDTPSCLMRQLNSVVFRFLRLGRDLFTGSATAERLKQSDNTAPSLRRSLGSQGRRHRGGTCLETDGGSQPG